jgi:hypothetical protein
MGEKKGNERAGVVAVAVWSMAVAVEGEEGHCIFLVRSIGKLDQYCYDEQERFVFR